MQTICAMFAAIHNTTTQTPCTSTNYSQSRGMV